MNAQTFPPMNSAHGEMDSMCSTYISMCLRACVCPPLDIGGHSLRKISFFACNYLRALSAQRWSCGLVLTTLNMSSEVTGFDPRHLQTDFKLPGVSEC